MTGERITDADMVVAQSLRLTELDIQVEAIDVASRKAVQKVRALLDKHHVSLTERLVTTVALAELAATISLARGQVRRVEVPPGKCETVRIGPADGRCCARESATGRRCTNLVSADRLSICTTAPNHAWEQPTHAQIEAARAVEPLPPNVRYLRLQTQTQK